jgi:HEAT repeat protein
MPLIRKPSSPAALGEPASAADPAAIVDALACGNDDERWSAARAAADLPSTVPALGNALAHERSPIVREAIFSALARIATPQSVEAVLPFLRSDDALIRTGASDALLAMKEVACPYVLALLEDQDPSVRVLACVLVRDMPSRSAAGLCCDLLDSEPDANVCAAAVETLAEIGDSSSLPALTRCADRFGDTPFLEFSIRTVIDRVRSRVASSRA